MSIGEGGWDHVCMSSTNKKPISHQDCSQAGNRPSGTHRFLLLVFAEGMVTSCEIIVPTERTSKHAGLARMLTECDVWVGSLRATALI